MASIVFKLRTAPGTIPFEEIDLTDRVDLVEAPPEIFDEVAEMRDGSEYVSRRAIRRRFRMQVQNLTEPEVDRLARWAHNRVLLGFNPCWNASTRLYTRFARQDTVSGLIKSMVGPNAAYARTLSSGGTYGTEVTEQNNQLRALATSRARFEQSSLLSAFNQLRGIRLFGKRTNYFSNSYPTNGTALWSFSGGGNISGNGSLTWTAGLGAQIIDTVGAYLLYAEANDWVARSHTPPAGQVCAGVWLRGEGTFELSLSGGATGTSGNIGLSPSVWTLLKVENVTASGAAVTVKLTAKATPSWCAIGGASLHAGRRLGGFILNTVTGGASVTEEEDAVSYSTFQFPHFACTLHVGVELPPVLSPSGGEQVILGIDATGGNRLVLKYDGTLGKFYFQKKTASPNVQWIADRAAGRGTVISVHMSKDSMIAYENGAFKTSAGGVVASLPTGLNVGWDGVTDTNGWDGLVFFVRVDEGPFDAGEIAYVSSLYNTSNHINLTRKLEGRLFRIDSPSSRIRAVKNFAELQLREVRSIATGTNEDP